MRWWRTLSLLLLLLLLLQSTTGSVAAADPELVLTAPRDGQDVAGPTVQVQFQVTGLTIVPSSVPLEEAGKHPEVNRPGEGHLHFMLDLEPLVVWYTTDPYTLTNLPPGRHHLMVELVNNDHSSLSPPVVREIQFQRTGQPAASAPQLTLITPTNGENVADADVQVEFQVAGLNIVSSNVPLDEAGQHPEANRPGEGHLHFMLDLEPLQVWYTTDAYSLADLPPGRHHLMVELVNNDHSSLSPPVVREIQFQRTPQTLPNTGQAAPREVSLLVAGLGGLLLVVGAGLTYSARKKATRSDCSWAVRPMVKRRL